MITTTFDPKTGPQVGDYVKTRGYNPSGQSVGRVAAINAIGLLVEFPKSHRGLHNGAAFTDNIPKCKEQHGWWVLKDEVEPLFIDAVVFKDGDQTYCQRAGKKRVTGIATRSDNDANKPFIGAFIALARAFGLSPVAAAKQVLATVEPKTEAPKKKLQIVRADGGKKYGVVGTPTKYRDKNGNDLFVGDLVTLKSLFDGRKPSETYFVADDEGTKYIMSIRGGCNAATGEIEGWEVTRVKKWTELTPGEKITNILGSVFEVTEVEEPPKKKRRVIRYANYPGPHSGILGTPTKLVDAAGHTLCVGDVVEIWTDTKGVLGEEPVVQDENHTDKFFVMGCAGKDFTKDGSDGGFRIRKVKSFTELRLEETLSDGWFVIKEEEADPKEEEVDPKKKLVLRWSFGKHKLLGNVGDPTPLIDRDGEKLCIGDQVECFCDGVPLSGIEPIVLFKECGPESNGGYYAMGLGSEDFAEGGNHAGYTIRKVKSYTELKPGELLSDGVVEVKEED